MLTGTLDPTIVIVCDPILIVEPSPEAEGLAAEVGVGAGDVVGGGAGGKAFVEADGVLTGVDEGVDGADGVGVGVDTDDGTTGAGGEVLTPGGLTRGTAGDPLSGASDVTAFSSSPPA